MDYTFSEKTKQVIGISQSLAREFFNSEFSPSHLLKALLHKEIGLRTLLEEMGKDFYYMEEWADVRIEQYPKGGKAVEQPAADKEVKAVFREAEMIRLKLSEESITPVCLLAALTIPGVGFTYEQLKTFNITQNEILDKLLEKSDLQKAVGLPSGNTEKTSGSDAQNALLRYCHELTTKAREGKLDPVVGRDREIRMISEILGRRSKPNVMVIGEQGVGKTALINGFAQNIVAGKIAGNLAETRIFELDYGSLVAGASYKGEVEDRLKGIIKEIQQFEKAILYMDNIHMLIDKQSGASGAANLMKPELDRGTLTVIGTTSIDNYTKTIETDESFNRAFEVIKLEEPDEERAVRMLEQIIPAYEKHHGLKAGQEILKEAVRLSRRYLKERSLPDAAIDLIDRSMAVVRSMKDTTPGEVAALKTELETLVKNEGNLSETDLRKDMDWFYLQLKERISPVILIKTEEQTDQSKTDHTDSFKEMLNELLDKVEHISGDNVESVEPSDLAAVVAHKTGVPIGKVKTSEKERLLNIESYLKKRVIGQDHAIKSIAEAIRESRSGLSKAGQPIGSFFFLGPTGTGKTELAKTLAEFLFNDETSLVRFDMSEFKEEHSAALLYGAPPGYVGYEEGGLLVNKIRQKPYSIVLFDEIEKAHTSVFDIFLQILDEGKLHDRLGKEGDFSNAVILFTSNIGSSFIVESFGKGEIPSSAKLAEIMEKYFRPEFLGRLTEIVPFAPISEENVVKIFDIHLKSLTKALENQGIELVLEQEAKEELARSGFSPKFGARPLIGVIRTRLRRPLSRKIISGEIVKGQVVTVKSDSDKELIWEISNRT
jgi:ATP-dependent Clp protease ATP-binding subunit ClpB